MCADVPTFLVLTIARLRLPFSLRHPQFKNTEHAANLFALKELGNIYTRLNNPTTHVLESRVAQLEGGHPLAAVAVASGTSACFYSIINLAQQANIVASSKLYGGTYTQFNDIATMGITVKFVDAEDEDFTPPSTTRRGAVLRDRVQPRSGDLRPRGHLRDRPREEHPAHRRLDVLHAVPHQAL